MEKFKFIEHTADIKFQAFGKSLEEAFKNSAIAMSKAIFNEDVQGNRTRNVEATGKDNERLLYDFKTDLQGFIGYLPLYKTIYVSLRGSSSKLNWMDDFEVKLVPYITYPDCNCKVHNGFYRSALGILNETIHTISILNKRFP